MLLEHNKYLKHNLLNLVISVLLYDWFLILELLLKFGCVYTFELLELLLLLNLLDEEVSTVAVGAVEVGYTFIGITICVLNIINKIILLYETTRSRRE